MEIRSKELMLKELKETLDIWNSNYPSWSKGTQDPNAVWMKPIFYWEPLKHAVVCINGFESRIFGLRRKDDFIHWINNCMAAYTFNVKERN